MKRFIAHSLLLLLLLFSCSCSNNSDAGEVIPKYEISFTKVASIENLDFSKQETVSHIPFMGRIDADKWGRVFVADGGLMRESQTVRVFNEYGNHVTDVGRSGSGPGEFRNLSHINIRSDRMIAYDEMQSKLNIYYLSEPGSEIEVEFSNSLKLDPGNWSHIDVLNATQPVEFYLSESDHVLIGFRQHSRSSDPDRKRMMYYFLMDMEGRLIPDKIFEREYVGFFEGTGVPGPQLISSWNFPFTRSSLFTVSGNGNIFSAWSEDFLIDVYDPDGNHLRTFEFPFKKSKLDRNEIIHLYADHSSSRVASRARRENFPETWPAMHQMIADDQNRLWVATITDDSEHYEWWVTDEYGKLLATFKWPGSRLLRTTEQQEIKRVKNDYVYTHRTYEDTEIEKIIVYRILMNGVD